MTHKNKKNNHNQNHIIPINSVSNDNKTSLSIIKKLEKQALLYAQNHDKNQIHICSFQYKRFLTEKMSYTPDYASIQIIKNKKINVSCVDTQNTKNHIFH